MEKRHSDALDSTFDALWHEPMVKLSKRQLRHFYSMERLSKNMWRDIFDRVPRWIGIDGLYMIDDGDDVYLIKKTHCKPATDQIE